MCGGGLPARLPACLSVCCKPLTTNRCQPHLLHITTAAHQQARVGGDMARLERERGELADRAQALQQVRSVEQPS